MSKFSEVRERILVLVAFGFLNGKTDGGIVSDILSDPSILIKAKNQELPPIPDIPSWWGCIGTYQEGQVSVARAGFVKVEKKEAL